MPKRTRPHHGSAHHLAAHHIVPTNNVDIYKFATLRLRGGGPANSADWVLALVFRGPFSSMARALLLAAFVLTDRFPRAASASVVVRLWLFRCLVYLGSRSAFWPFGPIGFGFVMLIGSFVRRPPSSVRGEKHQQNCDTFGLPISCLEIDTRVIDLGAMPRRAGRLPTRPDFGADAAGS